MLYHNDGITQVAQMTQSVDQLVIIPLMQTDARFIQNIQNSHEGRTDLGCKADTLTFSARQSCRCSGEGQIIQTNIF